MSESIASQVCADTYTYLGTDGTLSGRDGTPGTGRDGRDGGVGFPPEEDRGGAVCLLFL